MKILLAEDSKEMAAILQSILKRNYDGLHIVWEDDGEKALQEFRTCHKLISAGLDPEYDCVITDKQMPIRNGVSLAEEIKNIQRFVPIFLWTAGLLSIPPHKAALFRGIVGKDDHGFWVEDVFKEIYEKAHTVS